MLDPTLTEDAEVAQLTRDERWFLVGCLRNADDDGRLRGTHAFLKAGIFMYDDDIDLKRMAEIRDTVLAKMSKWHSDNMWRLESYQNGEQEYMHFPNWGAMEKPSHPTPSKLPEPPNNPSPLTEAEPSGETPELLPNPSRKAPSQSGIGQSSQDRSSIGKYRGVQEDFTEYIDSGKDLTDFLTETLEKYAPRGPSWMVSVLKKVWEQGVGMKMSQPLFSFTFDSVKAYPPAVLGQAFAKAVKYKGGKQQSYKYLAKILKEENEKAGGGRAPPS